MEVVMRRYFTLVALIPLLIVTSSTIILADNPGQPGETKQENITISGLERTYQVYIPAGELSGQALIIALHGSMGTGKKMQEISAYQFDRLADKKRCMVVYPDGYNKHWNDCRTIPNDEAHTKNIDDVGFISKLIDTCCTKWHVDPKKVYAVGLSNGGHMCFRLATEIPRKIAGIVVIGANMPASGMSKCPAPKGGFPVMIMNGTEDPINPFEGGMVRLFYIYSKGEVLSSLESARAWLRPDDREKHPAISQIADSDLNDDTHTERYSWPESKVCLYVIHGGGHTIPGGEQYLPIFLVGRVSRDMNMAEEVWRFFNETP
jgi:polyhydroxybutyrate depolymerase